MAAKKSRTTELTDSSAAVAETPQTTTSPSDALTPDTRMPGLFLPDGDNVVRGEVIIKLTKTGTDQFAESIPAGPPGTRSANSPDRFGLRDVDAVLRRHGARAVGKLHPPMTASVLTLDAAQALSQTFRVRFDETADVGAVLAELSAIAEVASVEPNRWREASVLPNDPVYAQQWALARIGCPEAWTITSGDPAIVVAVIDTGVDLDHPELAARMLPGQDMVNLSDTSPPPGTRYEGDWQNRDDTPQDEVGHGSHVAGTISCGSNNAVGTAGVTWGCSILPVKVLTRVVEISGAQRVHGIGSSADIAAGIRWAVDHGARVINLSLGGSHSTFVEQEAIEYAVLHGVVVVAAMGNDASSTPSYPAAFPGVVAVGAVDASGHLAAFSNTGAHVALVAPGVDILSTDWNDTYGIKSGTSMASPHVAGVAALVLSVNPALTADEVKQILVETAEPLREAPSDVVPNPRYGHGLVNAAAAVARSAELAGPQIPLSPNPRGTMTLPPGTFPPFTRPPFTRPRPPFTLTQPPLTLTRPPLTLTRPTFTRPTVTRPTRPPLTRPTRPTLTRPTRPTLTRPTLPTLTRPTLTRPTLPTLTRPTLPTLTRPTLPTLTRPTLTRPTLPTLTRPTLTRPTLPTLTRPT